MKIALLLPRSVIYPSLSFDIVDGLNSSFKNLGLEGQHQIVSAGIGVAAKDEDIYAHTEKLLLEGADIVIGYINPGSAQFIHPLFEASGKKLIVLDSGYHFPNFQGKLSNAYFISLQGGLCARVIAHKAIEEGYKDFAFTCSFFDAGYRPSYIYATTVEEKGGQIVFNHVTPLQRADFTLDPLVKYLESNKQTAVLASFCGDMAEDFFKESAALNIASNAIYGTGFTAEEQWLGKIAYPGNDWSVAVAWSKTLKTPENQEFVKTMDGIKEGKANLFSLLAWEAAQFIASGNDSLDGISINSPRGTVFMNSENRYTEAAVYYASIAKDENNGNCVLKDVETASYTENEREELKKNIASLYNININSWQNAYACLES